MAAATARRPTAPAKLRSPGNTKPGTALRERQHHDRELDPPLGGPGSQDQEAGHEEDEDLENDQRFSGTGDLMSGESLEGSPKPRLEEWEQFVSALKDEKREADGRHQWMFDFYARWQLAMMYKGINIGEHTLGVLEGYSVLVRVLIACSARELVVPKNSNNRRASQPIIDAQLATRIRSAWRDEDRDAFTRSLRKSANRHTVVGLNDFWSGKNDDIELIAFPIRHGVAHGSVTATGARLRGVRGKNDKDGRLEIIDAIAEAVLNDSAKLFLAIVEDPINQVKMADQAEPGPGRTVRTKPLSRRQ